MGNKTWKQRERVIAGLFGTKRTPLSGLSSGHNTSSDTLHKQFYIEVKHSSAHGSGGKMITMKKEWLDEMKKNCKKERKKLAFLVFHFKGDKENYAVLDLEDLRTLLGNTVVTVPEPEKVRTLTEFGRKERQDER